MTAPTHRPRGRPRSDASRGSRLELRVHPSEHVLLDQAADLTDEPVAAWVRRVAVEAARAALAEHGPMPEVALCPDCDWAETVQIEEYAPGDWHAACDHCAQSVDPLVPGALDRLIVTGTTRREAIERWNARADRARLERLPPATRCALCRRETVLDRGVCALCRGMAHQRSLQLRGRCGRPVPGLLTDPVVRLCTGPLDHGGVCAARPADSIAAPPSTRGRAARGTTRT